MKRFIYFAFVFCVSIMVGCSEMVRTGEVSNIEATTANVSVYIKYEREGCCSYYQYGALLGESEEDVKNQSIALTEEVKAIKKNNGRDFLDDCHNPMFFDGDVCFNRLNPTTQYYYRAWVIKNRKLYFGEIKTFETLDLPPISGTHEGHDYVDLGLPSGLKWATCNIGASNPEEYGDFFAWAEVKPKKDYLWTNYRHVRRGSYDPIKYSIEGSYKTKRIHLSDDAAHVNWGGDWRMPTIYDYEELRTTCDFLWTNQKGVYGLMIKGPSGYSIFLPAAGFMSDPVNSYIPQEENHLHKGRSVLYWLSTYDTDVRFSSSKIANCINRDGNWARRNDAVSNARYRCHGFPIRPVCP